MTTLEYIRQQFTVLSTALKTLSICLFCFIFTLFSTTSPAAVTPENIIVTLNINDEVYYDYEVIVNPDGSFSLPFKYTAKLLGIKYQQNHYTKEIKYLNTTIDVKNSRIYSQNKTITVKTNKIISLKEGLLEGITDEIFIPVNAFDEMLQDKISADRNNYSVKIETERQIALLETENLSPADGKVYKSTIKRDVNIVLPKRKSLFSFDSMDINTSFQGDYTTERNLTTTRNDKLYNTNYQTVFKGKLLGGNYSIRSNIRSYDDDLFSFGGITANYERQWKNYKLELGSISGLQLNDINIGSQIIGIGFNNFNRIREKKQNLKDFIVNPDSDVNIYVNNDYKKTLNAKEALKNINNLIDETPDKTVKEKKFEPIEFEPDKKEFAVIAGVTGYENVLFSSYPLANDETAKKIVGGIQYKTPLSDKTTLNSVAIADYIYDLPDMQEVQSFLSQSPVLALSISKDFRFRQGNSFITSLEHQTFRDFYVKSDIGTSFSKSRISGFNQNTDTFGYLGTVSLNYKKDNKYNLSTELFEYSPDFYLAGSSGYSGYSSKLNDKRGFKVQADYNNKYFNTSGHYSKYLSNLDNYISGGKFNFDDYKVSLRVPINKIGTINLYRSAKKGRNSNGRITSDFNRIDYDKRINSNLSFYAGWLLNNFRTKYSDITQSSSDYDSRYSNLTGKINYKIHPKVGTISVIHDMTTTKTDDFERDSNAVRIGYTFPKFFNIKTSITTGYKYKALDKGFDLSAMIGYEFPSGRTLSLNYQFNRQTGIFIDDLYLPTSSRHSFSVNLTDALSFIGGGVKSTGSINKNDGFIEAIAFLDVNKNGIKDKKEPQIPNIPINLSGNKSTVYTNKKGKYLTKALQEGFYNVKIDYNDLPTLVSVSPESKNEYLAKVEPGKATKLYFGFISSVGNLSGKVLVKDEFGREIKIDGLVITIKDEEGKEVDYTTVSEGETYYIAGLSPGIYSVSLDKSFLEAYNLFPKQKEQKITIPPVFDEYVDIKDFNLEYIQGFEAI